MVEPMSNSTVGTLIQALWGLPQNAIVVMSKDQEGNSFSPYWAFSRGHYEPTSTWAGEFETHDTATEDEVNAICLWPVN